jgi:hypothetical protein
MAGFDGRRWSVLAAICLLAAGLSACNLVTTTEPMFAAADASGAPALREGLWANIEPNCRVDLKQPASRWPDCASRVVIQDGMLYGKDKDDEGEQALAFVLAAGDPRILQMRLVGDKAEETLYFYIGLDPRKLDSQGRIVEYAGWLVQCGPPPPKDSKRPDGQTQYGTLEPFPGLIMDDNLASCAPVDKASLTAAAAASLKLDPEASGGAVSRWVRDGKN